MTEWLLLHCKWDYYFAELLCGHWLYQDPQVVLQRQVNSSMFLEKDGKSVCLHLSISLLDKYYGGQNTGVGSCSLLQGIFPTQWSNPRSPYCRWILYHLGHQRSPGILGWVTYPFSRGSSGPRNQTGVSHIAGIKNLPAMQDTWVHPLSWEDPLEESMATHSSILAWRIPMDGRA